MKYFLKGRISISEYQELTEDDKKKYARYCGHKEVYYILVYSHVSNL